MKLSLKELLEQKALLENHLAWLNRQISQFKTETPEADNGESKKFDESREKRGIASDSADTEELKVDGTPLPLSEKKESPEEDDSEEKEISVEQFEDYSPPEHTAQNIKRSCLVWSISLFALGCLGVLAIVWIYSNNR